MLARHGGGGDAFGGQPIAVLTFVGRTSQDGDELLMAEEQLDQIRVHRSLAKAEFKQHA